MANDPNDAMLSPIPAVEVDDPEDVSWALSTAEAMWSRGERGEAIKWIRRGAEAASEAESDDRALMLARAAAGLASSLGMGTGTSAPPGADRSSAHPPGANRSSAHPPGDRSSAHPADGRSLPPRALQTVARTQGPSPGRGILSGR